MARDFQIPKRFQLYGHTITVDLVTKLRATHDITGCAIFRENRIEVQPSVEGVERPRSQVESTFFHELVHWIFYLSNGSDEIKPELHEREGLVDRCASLLHQAITTMEFEE